jgi:uncharacterized protein YjiS (DUF1127 family)
MEQTLKSQVDPPSGFLVTLRSWARRFRAFGQRRQDRKALAGLPDHLLRDIGCEEFIAPRNSPGPYGY